MVAEESFLSDNKVTMKNYKQGFGVFIIIGIIAVVALGGVGVYYGTKSMSDKEVAANLDVQADVPAFSSQQSNTDTTSQPKSSALTLSDEATLKSNISTMRAIAELKYDADGGYQNVCKDGRIATTSTQTQYSASVPVESILKVRNVSSQGEAGIVCVNSKTEYAISIELESGSAFCIDSTGIAQNGRIATGQKKCEINKTGF
jgi:hypothetical protein